MPEVVDALLGQPGGRQDAGKRLPHPAGIEPVAVEPGEDEPRLLVPAGA